MDGTRLHCNEVFTKSSRNCDGGLQERDAATEAIHNAVPDAEVVFKVLNSYPIEVTVYYGTTSMFPIVPLGNPQ